MISFQSYMILMRVRNPEATISKAKAIEKIFKLDPVN